MDTRTTSADFYPGGKTPVTAGGGITSGETGGAAGEPMVPVTKVEQLPEHYRESDMRSKINELARVISGGVAAIMAMVSLTLGAEPVKVLGAKKDALWNDDFVVTNVVVDSAKFATTNTVTGATNALAASFVRGLEVATNAVIKAGAKEIAAATNALSESVDERLKASTNGSFSASSLEPYAKRTWVEAQGYLKSTNLTGYAQVNWVQNQGYIKKENASGEIARIVDEKIAAQDSTAAYRLMAVDGSKWIDGTGVCWEVTSHVRIDGEELSSKGIVQEWQKVDEGTEKRMSYSDENGLRNWAYSKILKWRNDPDDPNSTEEFVEYLYNGSTNLTAGTVMLCLETEDPQHDQNGTYPPEYVILEYWLTTNTVTRLATTNDMPKIDFTLTTNDVCAIVTNEVAEKRWVTVRKPTLEGVFEIGEPYYIGDVRGWGYNEWAWDMKETNWLGEVVIDAPDYAKGESDDVYLEFLATGAIAELRPSLATRNALGLAMAKDVEKLPTHEVLTNTIQYVVTNEVASGWVCTPALYQGKTIEVRLDMTNDGIGAYRPYAGDEMIGSLADSDFPPVVGSTLDWGLAWSGAEPLTAVYMGGGNALGLAMVKDLEKLPTHETVTNVARSVVNSVWDASLGVAWEARMHNGHLYYIAVTNRQEVK